MNTIESNLCDLEDRISSACIRAGRKRSQITLVAVTKSVDTTAIRVAHGCGIQHFAENRVQEAS